MNSTFCCLSPALSVGRTFFIACDIYIFITEITFQDVSLFTNGVEKRFAWISLAKFVWKLNDINSKKYFGQSNLKSGWHLNSKRIMKQRKWQHENGKQKWWLAYGERKMKSKIEYVNIYGKAIEMMKKMVVLGVCTVHTAPRVNQ